MILINKYMIILYCFILIGFLYKIIIKKQINKYSIIFCVYLIITFISSIYYYRTLSFNDILDKEKYEFLFNSSTIVIAEEEQNISFKSNDLIYYLKNAELKNTIKTSKQIKENFLGEENSYVVKNMEKNIFRFKIIGDYEYIEYGGKYYKCLK